MAKLDGVPNGKADDDIYCYHCHQRRSEAGGECCVYHATMFEDLFRNMVDISNAFMVIVPESLRAAELTFRNAIVRRCKEIVDLHGGGDYEVS